MFGCYGNGVVNYGWNDRDKNSSYVYRSVQWTDFIL